MLYDFSKTCKTYNKDSYNRNSFSKTTCPRCRAIGRFKMHGSYERNVAYFNDKQLVFKLIAIRRVRCKSCGTTHAVLPGDIIAYRLLSLFVFLYVLFLLYIRNTPVLKIANDFDCSFQFLYSIIGVFEKYAARLHLFFRRVSPRAAPLTACQVSLLVLILSYVPWTKFQHDYMAENKKPCFMGKFSDGTRGPPVGIVPL